MADLIGLFLAQVEGYYGEYPTAEIREDVRKYLSWRVALTKAHLESVYEAMKERQALRFGAPDVATTREAIEAWEKTRDRSLSPPRQHSDFCTAPRPSAAEAKPPTPEEVAQVHRMIREAAATNPAAELIKHALGI